MFILTSCVVDTLMVLCQSFHVSMFIVMTETVNKTEGSFVRAVSSPKTTTATIFPAEITGITTAGLLACRAT